jgi:cellobiose phosphorylase
MRDGVLAGYAVFTPEGTVAELLLHPSDTRTGLTYSLLPMKRALIAGLFAGEAVPRHLGIIRDHLMFPDGARLMDRPVAYHGGVEQLFRRAESAAYFGREIGLMYTHAHLRTGEALAAHGQADAVWRTLLLANPVAVTDILPNATPRQRNAYFSSSDAAFADRYAAGTEWQRVKDGTIAVDGGWRVYSSGPGLYTNLLLRHVFGLRRNFGDRVFDPLLPPGHADLAVELARGGETRRYGPS